MVIYRASALVPLIHGMTTVASVSLGEGEAVTDPLTGHVTVGPAIVRVVRGMDVGGDITAVLPWPAEEPWPATARTPLVTARVAMDNADRGAAWAFYDR